MDSQVRSLLEHVVRRDLRMPRALACWFAHSWKLPGAAGSRRHNELIQRRCAGGYFSKAPRMPVKIRGAKATRYITVQRAPEPTDLCWENARPQSIFSLQMRRVLIWATYFGALGVSLGLQVAIARVTEQERTERLRKNLQNAIDKEDSSVKNSDEEVSPGSLYAAHA